MKNISQILERYFACLFVDWRDQIKCEWINYHNHNHRTFSFLSFSLSLSYSAFSLLLRFLLRFALLYISWLTTRGRQRINVCIDEAMNKTCTFTWPSILISINGNGQNILWLTIRIDTNKNGSLTGLINRRRNFRVHCLPRCVFQLIRLVLGSFLGTIWLLTNNKDEEKRKWDRSTYTR